MDQQRGKRFPQEGKELVADGLTKPLQGQAGCYINADGATIGLAGQGHYIGMISSSGLAAAAERGVGVRQLAAQDRVVALTSAGAALLTALDYRRRIGAFNAAVRKCSNLVEVKKIETRAMEPTRS